MASQNRETTSQWSEETPRSRWALHLPAQEVAPPARPACEQWIRQVIQRTYPAVDLGIRWDEAPQIVLLELGATTSERERSAMMAQISACLSMFHLSLRRMAELCPEVFDPRVLLPPAEAMEGSEGCRELGRGAHDEPETVN